VRTSGPGYSSRAVHSASAGWRPISRHSSTDVAPHAGQLDALRDPVARELVGRSDAREHEQLRRLQRAGAQDDLAAGLDRAAGNVDARAARAREAQPQHPRAGVDREVAMIGDGLDERGRPRLAHAVADRELRIADAVERGAVVVVVERDAGLLRGRHHRGEHRVRLVARRDPQWPAGAVQLVGAAIEVLDRLEHGQHVVPAPAGTAAVGPTVVVQAMAADVDHPVERARAAHHLAARPVQAPPGAPLLGLGVVRPVDLGEPELRPAPRVVDRRVGRGPAGLDERHRRAAVEQRTRGRAAGRAPADHDVVVRRHVARRESESIATAVRMIAPWMIDW
jgi:hypothetical protein